MKSGCFCCSLLCCSKPPCGHFSDQEKKQQLEGNLLANMKLTKKTVQKHIQILCSTRDCEQSEQGRKVQREIKQPFQGPKCGTTHAQRLLVDGHIITDKEAVRDAWAQHFIRLNSSMTSALSKLDNLIHSYRLVSFPSSSITTSPLRRSKALSKISRGEKGGWS